MTARSVLARFERPFRRLAFPLLRVLDAVVQRVLPVKADRVLYASVPDYADSAFAMYRHLLATRRDLEHVWFVRNASLASRIRDEFEGSEARGHTLVVLPWTMRSYPAFARARYAFHTHGVFGFSVPVGRRTSVSLWHGMPVKAIRRLHTGDVELFPVHGTVHLATSSFFRYIIAGTFDVHPSKVLVSGLPRVDVLKGKIPPRHDRQQIATRLGLDPAKRWVLWMPTHRSEANPARQDASRTFVDALEPGTIDALEEAAGQHDAEIIVKLHPFDLLNDRPTQLGRERITLLTAAQWEATAIQLYDLVAASDALITDISSVFIDYLHTGNPIGILGYEESRYTRTTLFDHSLLLRCQAARPLATADDVRQFVAGLADGRPPAAEAADLSVVFNEDHDITSAAFVADAVGL